ncbi:MAG: alpha/beta fold hydrolase, partial [Alphaproteobacteria bacterium]
MLDNPPDASPFLSVNAIRTEIVRRGSGKPLLFLHPELGLLPTASVLDKLGASFAVTAPSLPGYGRTEFPRAWN